MKTHRMTFTTEEVYALRDAVSDRTVQQRTHVKDRGEQASERARRLLAALEALLDDLKQEVTCG